MSDFIVRAIEKGDNQAIAAVIRAVLEEHKMNKPGTVYTDPTTDDLFSLFQQPKSFYWILEKDGEIVGGCGVFPTKGLPEKYGELVKLYLSSNYRGQGLGKMLLNKCAEDAKGFGYESLYLESMPELNSAVGLYRSVGYQEIDAPLGESGHFACNLWMIKQLD